MDGVSYARYLLALVFVLALMGFIAWIVTYLSQRQFFTQFKGHSRRLSIKETLLIDPKTKAVLLGIGTKEHLILVSHQGNLLLSTEVVQESTVSPQREVQS